MDPRLRTSPSGLSPARLAAVCFATATLLSSRQIAAWTDLENRYLYHWQRIDALALVAFVVGSAALSFGVAQIAMARWGGRAHRVLRAIFVLTLIEVGLAYLVRMPEYPPWWLAWIVPVAVFAVALLMLVAAERLLYRAAVAIALLLSPLGVILLGQLIAAPSVDIREVTGVSSAPPANRPPIVIVILDGWSWQRSTSAGKFLESLPNLRLLAESSTQFSNAVSGGAETLTSIPRLIAQSPVSPMSPSDPWWVLDGPNASAAPEPRLFTNAARAGYSSQVIGFYLPYRELVGEVVGKVVVEPHWPKGATLGGKMALVALRNVAHLGDPLARWLGQRLERKIFNRYWYDLNRRIQSRTIEAVAELQRGHLVLVHFALPHSPFVFSADGTYQGDSVRSRMEPAPAKYAVHMEYVDKLVGEIIAELRRNRMFDNTMLILTSDHSWTSDPEQHELTRVPLIIKWPAQLKGVEVSIRACLVGLQAFLDDIERKPLSRLPDQLELGDLTRASCREVGG